ncbi:IS4 family transposase [uncultured Gimesia sp.]|uniref:IS4 family transposase n=1 Tax=uncultured Gimesia sp. TaxID=1678688 RepID=UPI00261B480C|nr:IS4 family transposase [uncultured Gimesia sp.]
MSVNLSESQSQGSSNFQLILDSFLSSAGLPFSKLLSAKRIARIFARHNGLFGTHGVYSTAVMLWSFLGQVLRDGKEASCQSAVARVIAFCKLTGEAAPTADTRNYCRARAKLSVPALREISCEVASELEDAAEESWLWKGRHAKLIDGFTFTMPDTESNQAEFPQQNAQAPGCGLPIARAVAVLSLATACMLDVAIGPYKGKQSGETALLRKLFGSLNRGDVAIFDRYYCSYMMIASLLRQETDVCTRLHHKRRSDFRRGKRLGKYDHLVTWIRPKRCPTWMDQATFLQIPETILLREIRYQVVERGRRTQAITIITTLLDDEHTKAEIAELYGVRWNVELDLRSIKDTLNLGHLRCKSPAMIRCELWTTILGYNLIRTTAAGAALLHQKRPRQISFTAACQFILTAWMLTACGKHTSQALREMCRALANQIATCEVGNRPGRIEPRVIKRRRGTYPLMQLPRQVLRDRLRNNTT